MGQEAAETEGLARQLAAERGATFISPCNDRDVIVGKATIALEESWTSSAIGASTPWWLPSAAAG